MWKGIAWLMLLYGLLVSAAAIDAAEKQQGMGEMFASWQQNYAALKEHMEQDGIQPPHVARFDGHDPLAAVSSHATVAINDDGVQAWLDWTPDRQTAKLDLLGLLVSPGPPEANGLALRLRANYEGQVIIGVMEADGSSYMVFPERLELDWTQYEMPLDALVLSDDSEDENGQLDVDQVDTVLIGYLEVSARGEVDAEQRVISIDDVFFREFHDNPLFPDFQRGPGPDGMGGPGGPPPGAGMEGERPRDRMRERIKDRLEGGEASDMKPSGDADG